jgi:hypothetical protein
MAPKKLKKMIRFYPICFFFLLDNWLKKMSLKGWHLIDYGFGFYVFEKGKPLNKEYFTYSCDYTGDGKYSILLRYPALKQKYGVNKKNSKLNKNNVLKGNTTIEVDTNRIDITNDLGYKELKHDRNRLYMLITIRNITAFSLVAIITLFFIVLSHAS